MNPTPGFEFPTDSHQKIENALRGLHAPATPAAVQSVRPERQKQVLVVPKVDVQNGQALTASQIVPGTMRPVPQQDPTPVSTADYISLDLPSRFAFYPFSDLYIKPFRAPHLAKLAKADAQNSLQLIAETVSSVLMTPAGHQNIAFDLSITDLNAVMYWLRMNSFTKQTMGVVSQCDNPKHHHEVDIGEVLPETLQIKTTVTQSDVEITYLESMPDPEKYRIKFDDQFLEMRPETVRDSIQFLDHPNWTDEEIQFKVRVVSVLNFEKMRPDVQWTLALKLDFYDSMLSNEDILLAHEFAELMDNFGVVETVKTRCGKCGASGTARLSFDARTFLSPSF